MRKIAKKTEKNFCFQLEKPFLSSYSKPGKKVKNVDFELKMTKKTHIQRFTLIELLVVIGIAGLLFVLMGPAFQNMIRSNAVERHASGLKGGMERARALAVSGRRYAALLLPYGEDDNGKEHYNFQRGGFRLGYVIQNSSGAFEFDGLAGDSEWQNRGEMAYLTALTTESNTVLSSEKPMENFTKEPKGLSTLFNVPDVPSGGSTCACRALVFSPYGSVVAPGDASELYFHVTGVDVDNRIVLRLNKFSGKVEYVDNEKVL